MRQSYICDQCGVESHVDLRDDPDDHRKWSPECTSTKVQISDVEDPMRRYYVELTS